MNFRVEIERDMCILCGNCIDTCDDIFEVGKDDVVQLIDGDINDDNFSIKEYDNIDCLYKASQQCPVACIIIFEKDTDIAIT